MAGAQISFVHSPWPLCEVMMTSYDDAAPDYPGTHGTGFFVTFCGALYLLTARHCMGKLGDDIAERAARLLIPASAVPAGQKVTVADYVRFSRIGRAVATERLDEFLGDNEGDLGIVALEVADDCPPDVLAEVRARSVVLPPTGEWLEKSLRHFANDGQEPVFRMRGYPQEGTETQFEYGDQRIVMQAVEQMGQHIGPGRYLHTRQLRVFDNSPVNDHNGMSGSPVRMRVSGPSEERYALVGMVLGGRFPNVFCAGVEWLTAVVQSTMADV